jgi:hypothetical protein
MPLPVTVSIPPGAKVPPAASEPLIRAAVVKVTDPRLAPEHAGEQGPPVTVVNTEAGLRVIVVRLEFAANVPLLKLKVVKLLAVASSDKPITRTVTANILGYAIGLASSTVTAHFVTLRPESEAEELGPVQVQTLRPYTADFQQKIRYLLYCTT